MRLCVSLLTKRNITGEKYYSTVRRGLVAVPLLPGPPRPVPTVDVGVDGVVAVAQSVDPEREGRDR